MTDSTEAVYIVAVSVATGNQGREIVQRFQELNESGSSGKTIHVRALTRNTTSRKSIETANMKNVSVTAVDYTSHDSLAEAVKGCDAVFVNYIMCKEEFSINKNIIDAAVGAKVKHIIYSSTLACETETSRTVPHWNTSYQTEQYVREVHEKSGDAFRYHFIRLGHFNENLLPGSYFPPKNGKVTVPWNPTAGVYTSSLRDAARVTCKLFVDNTLLENGAFVDCVTEYCTSQHFAKMIADATKEDVVCVKGPWIFVKFGQYFGWSANSIITMARVIESSHLKDTASLTQMQEFLKEETKDEPLETFEKFAIRNFGTARA